MTEMAALKERASRATEHFDVVIVGAGISGVAAARHLNEQCPGLSYVILEAQESFGGTWLTHKFPGIRSDSDLYTFGYRFKPWTGKPIATAAEILAYMGEVIEDPHIKERKAFVDRNHPTAGPVKLLAPWIHMSKTPASIRTDSPAIGQHTDEVLGGVLGLGAAELGELRSRGVVK